MQVNDPANDLHGARRKAAGDGRRASRDERPNDVTGGVWPGTAEARRWLFTGWALSVAIVSAVCFVNVLTIRHEAPHLGWAAPLVWEGSSALSTAAFAWLPWLVVRWSLRRPRPLWLSLAPHLPAAVLYSVLHVGLFVLLRRAAFGLAGETYRFGPVATEFPYELRKDLLVYAGMAGVFWVVRRLSAAEAPRDEAPSLFDIRDGARLVRAPIRDILAVTSAGNYAEFVLADGRRPLMRSSLTALEQRLGEHGFVRTHRSWLVNARRVTGLNPEGSGDYTVQLGELGVPLSRRFRGALDRLRQTT